MQRISVSNIAWENKELEEHLGLLSRLECDGVEIAPSCIWGEPALTSREDAKIFKSLVKKFGLEIPALHALLFTRPELKLFESLENRIETVKYLKRLIRLAGWLDAPVLVFGSPKNRSVAKRNYRECYDIAKDVFAELGKEALKHDTCFCIEPLGPSECDFIMNAEEGCRMVEDVDSPGFGFIVDAKAMIDAKEDFELAIKKYAKIIKHLHVGDPGIAPPGYTGFDHSLIGRPLSRSSYNGFISIEMRRGFGDSKETIIRSVQYVREKYGKKD